MIRVFIVEDHPMFREGLRAAIRHAGYEVAGEADCGTYLTAQLAQTQPDLLLLDLNLADPQFDPPNVVRKIHAVMPALKIVVLSAHAEIYWIEVMLASGVAGYVHKGDPPHDLIDGIRTLIEGTQPRWFSRTIINKIVARQASRLSEVDVIYLRAMAAGKTDQQIADETAMSIRTVQRQIKVIIRTLNANTRSEAVARAVKEGLIE